MRRPPAEAGLHLYFQVSAPTVHQMILTLDRLPLIRRVPRRARTIELLVAVKDLRALN